MPYTKGKVWKPGDRISYEDLNDLQKRAEGHMPQEPKADPEDEPKDTPIGGKKDKK